MNYVFDWEKEHGHVAPLYLVVLRLDLIDSLSL
jgi:hypothetical protein